MNFRTLADGSHIPILGLGTGASKPNEVGIAIKSALEAGYKYFDLADMYHNQKEIGVAFAEAFRSGKYKREDLFITSKLSHTHHHAKDVIPELQQTLMDLQISYLDLYSIHHPFSVINNGEMFPVNSNGTRKLDPNPPPVIETWREMEKIKESGLAKHIGVSNFKVQLLNDLCAAAKIKPEDNQVELHPYNQQNGLVDFCQKKGIHVTAYSPLLNGKKIEEIDPYTEQILQKIALKHQKSTAQIMIRWGFQRNPNISVIPKSVTPSRIKENIEVFDFELDADDMNQIAQLDRKKSVFDIHQLWGIAVFD